MEIVTVAFMPHWCDESHRYKANQGGGMAKLRMVGFLWVFVFGCWVSLGYSASCHSESKVDAVTSATPVLQGEAICPVRLESFKVTKESPKVEYQGKTYYLCCPGCISEFKENPKKYVSRIKEIKIMAKDCQFTPGEVKVKQGNIVRLALISHDNPCGLTIKDYGIDLRVNKGEAKKVEFLADKKGTFTFSCSVPCGPGHDRMKGKLIVE